MFGIIFSILWHAPGGSGLGLMGVLMAIALLSRTNWHWRAARWDCKAASKKWKSFFLLSSLFHLKVGILSAILAFYCVINSLLALYDVIAFYELSLLPQGYSN
jgi:uncharacterized membrane protein